MLDVYCVVHCAAATLCLENKEKICKYVAKLDYVNKFANWWSGMLSISSSTLECRLNQGEALCA